MSDWNISKKKEFVAKMGKKKARMAKGGLVKRVGDRRYFDDGGKVYALSGKGGGAVNAASSNTNKAGIGGLTDLLGLNNNFTAGSANIQEGTNVDQLMKAYEDAQMALGVQQNVSQTFQPGAASAVNAQNQLLAQEIAMANGEGPNPAQAALAQATGANVANQAALMASQRGASANAGMMARQAAQQGAATQQQSVGQAATMMASQQIAARQAAAQLAAQQAAQAQGAATAQNQAQQAEQKILQDANTAYNNAGVGMQSNMNTTNAETAIANQKSNQNLLGGIASSLSGMAANLFAEGGEVAQGPHKSHVANYLMMKDGGPVEAMVSPGEVYLNPEKVRQVIEEGKNPMKIGHRIGGKPKVKGDSLKNDIVPMTLQEGGVVIPRHIATHKMAPEKAELFVHRALARKKVK